MDREIRKQKMIKERSEYKKYFNGHVIMECIKDINVKEIDPFKEFIIKMFCNEENFINFVMELKGNTFIKEYIPIWYKQLKKTMDKITFRKVKDDSETHSTVFLNGKHVGYIKIVTVIKKGYIFEHVNGWRNVASSTLKEVKLKAEINVNRIENK